MKEVRCSVDAAKYQLTELHPSTTHFNFFLFSLTDYCFAKIAIKAITLIARISLEQIDASAQ
jgi:hypothetical protein